MDKKEESIVELFNRRRRQGQLSTLLSPKQFIENLKHYFDIPEGIKTLEEEYKSNPDLLKSTTGLKDLNKLKITANGVTTTFEDIRQHLSNKEVPLNVSITTENLDTGSAYNNTDISIGYTETPESIESKAEIIGSIFGTEITDSDFQTLEEGRTTLVSAVQRIQTMDFIPTVPVIPIGKTEIYVFDTSTRKLIPISQYVGTEQRYKAV